MPKYDGLRKYKRDKRIWRYAQRHPDLAHREIALKFKISRPSVSRILKIWREWGEFH